MTDILLPVYGCAALVAFIFAGLAFFDRFRKRKKVWTSVHVFFLTLPLFLIAFHFFLLPEIVLKRALPTPEGKQFLKTVRTYDPGEYANLRLIIAKNAFRANSLEQIKLETRQWSEANTKKYLKTADPVVVADFGELLLKEIEILRQKDPELCYALLFNFKEKPTPEQNKRLVESLPPEVQLEEMRILTRLIETSSADYLLLEPPFEVQLVFKKAIEKFKEKYGEEGVAVLADREKLLADKPKSVEMLLDLLSTVRTEPSRRKGEVFRVLFSKGLTE